MKVLRGCENEVHPRVIEGFQVSRCPLQLITFSETIALQTFKEYQAGYLPNDGGWLDQPMKFSAIIQLIDGIARRLEEKRKDAKSGT